MTFCPYSNIFNVRTKSEVMKLSPRTGRPKSDNPKDSNLYIRVTKEEKEEIMNFSKESGYSLLEIIKIGIEKVRGRKK